MDIHWPDYGLYELLIESDKDERLSKQSQVDRFFLEQAQNLVDVLFHEGSMSREEHVERLAFLLKQGCEHLINRGQDESSSSS